MDIAAHFRKASQKKKILIGGTIPLYIEGLNVFLKDEFTVLDPASTEPEVLRKAGEQKPDMLILHFPIETAEFLAKKIRKAFLEMKIVVILDNPKQLDIALRLEASYLMENNSPKMQVMALRYVFNGRRNVDPHLAAELVAEMLENKLKKRQ